PAEHRGAQAALPGGGRGEDRRRREGDRALLPRQQVRAAGEADRLDPEERAGGAAQARSPRDRAARLGRRPRAAFRRERFGGRAREAGGGFGRNRDRAASRAQRSSQSLSRRSPLARARPTAPTARMAAAVASGSSLRLRPRAISLIAA